MTKKLMILAAGALAVFAFAALPTGVSAEEMQAHCSAAPCEGLVQSISNAVLTEDSGTSITCTTTTGTVTQTAATSTTVNVILTFDECTLSCQNEGAGTKKIVTPEMTGHLITVTKGTPASAGILITNINFTFYCVILGIPVNKWVTGRLIGTFENPECGKAVTNHTISFTSSGTGQQTHKVYTFGTFDLLSNNTTASQTGGAYINYAGGKTVTITC